MIAPFNRFDLLLGLFLSNLILISIPFALILILNYIIYPISFITLLFVLFIYCIITLIFSGIGLIIGSFAISNENIWNFLIFAINLIFWASCISYPFALFPQIIQEIISFNPLYYIFTILRFSWVNNSIITTITNFYPHFIVLIVTGILISFIAVFTFNKVFKKFGIVGY
ncbi:MAG: ABC transporter permease [Candidatus Lokiarchaeota archaeon]